MSKRKISDALVFPEDEDDGERCVSRIVTQLPSALLEISPANVSYIESNPEYLEESGEEDEAASIEATVRPSLLYEDLEESVDESEAAIPETTAPTSLRLDLSTASATSR